MLTLRFVKKVSDYVWESETERFGTYNGSNLSGGPSDCYEPDILPCNLTLNRALREYSKDDRAGKINFRKEIAQLRKRISVK